MNAGLSLKSHMLQGFYRKSLFSLGIFGFTVFFTPNSMPAKEAPTVENVVAVRSFSQGLAALQIGKKWGFINKKGKVKIKPTYEKVKSFSQGLAAVKIRGKWGFINKKGKLKIKAVYEAAYPFSQGMAAVKKDGLWYYINKKGKIIIQTTSGGAAAEGSSGEKAAPPKDLIPPIE